MDGGRGVVRGHDGAGTETSVQGPSTGPTTGLGTLRAPLASGPRVPLCDVGLRLSTVDLRLRSPVVTPGIGCHLLSTGVVEGHRTDLHRKKSEV